MSTHNLNTPNKQWLMYLNTLSSISGDDLTIKPDNARNLLLEVSANNNIFMKKGTTSFNLTNLTNYLTGDISFSNIDVSQNLNPLLSNSSLGLPNKMWGNAYIRDISVTNMSISGTISNVRQIIPTNDISTSLGNSLNMWQKAFIRDLSGITSINGSNWPVTGPTGPTGPTGATGATGPTGASGELGVSLSATLTDISNFRITTNHRIYQNINKKPIYELNTTIQSWNWHKTNAESLGKTLAVILNAAQNEEVRLLISTYTFIGGIRKVTNTNNGTSLAWEWINGDPWNYTNWDSGEPGTIEEIVKIHPDGKWHDWHPSGFDTHAVYMSYEDSVNGYYGLAKDAYPSLNPLSSGDLAVKTWTARVPANDDSWRDICWSPQLGLFVAVAFSGTNRVMTSSDGINWDLKTAAQLSTTWVSVCWSPELRIFVAVAEGNLTNSVMTSTDGTTWALQSAQPCNWLGVCWSPQLGIFVAVANGGSNRIMTSSDGITWIPQSQGIPVFAWNGVCWSPQLGLFVAVSFDGASRVMTSSNGTTWTPHSQGIEANNWISVCWSPELGLFVAVAYDGINNNRLMTSSNGTTWTSLLVQPSGINWGRICWSSELRIFVAVALSGQVITSPNGINWTFRSAPASAWGGVCWSPELGIFAAVAYSGNRVMTSSLKARPPTSTNVFDSSFNSISENGTWIFANVATTGTLTVNTTVYGSDDRLKHNEAVINNGLAVIDKLCPKFYQKTQTLLDASYNGDLSGYTWNYEAGLIAQEVLQIPELSYLVSGGDYYEAKYIYKRQTNDLSYNYYEVSGNNYEVSGNNYEVSYNLITRAYNLNYNSVFVYGLAAIKELHAKVKAKETSILNRQAIINSLTARIEALEHNLSS